MIVIPNSRARVDIFLPSKNLFHHPRIRVSPTRSRNPANISKNDGTETLKIISKSYGGVPNAYQFQIRQGFGPPDPVCPFCPGHPFSRRRLRRRRQFVRRSLANTRTCRSQLNPVPHW